MTSRLLLVLGMLFLVSSCGTKSELDLRNGKSNPHGQTDPSQPPNPISR